MLTASPAHLLCAAHRASRWRFLRACLLVFAALAGAAACAVAQGDAAPPTPDPSRALPATASMHGVVTSTEGAVYEGARVVLESSGSADLSATAQTDSNGAFSFANLAPGAFKLTVSAPGFLPQSISGVLHAGEDFDAHTIALPVAAATNEVRVSAESQIEIAQAQLNIEEKQRVLGVFPNYYVSYNRDAVPLNARQKYQLAWRTAIDPVTWLMTGVVAGGEQASNTFAGYGQGVRGYGKRFGANYADGLSDTMIGGAILPSLFKQDPRYFYKGTGSTSSRAMFAIANSVICKGDNGRWQPNYSAILGGIAAGGISNLYYPSGNRSGVQVTFTNALIGTAEGAMQNLAQEFIVRRLTPKLPKFPSTVTQ
ncbi:MAG: carboxypeptidase-like regulatory domain-containing protein [Terracidiphilus sp.]|nr:carboxypeptidase-like regulatory domain-containing protein [Terracidiphilus sp.]MDR3799650.1 carboxypeptidase-like regulatory domain-containing protein [Terracidiphilus sp.]